MANFSDPGGDYNPYAPPSPTSEIAPSARDDDDEPMLILAERGTRWWARVVDNLMLGVTSVPTAIMFTGHTRDLSAALALLILPFALLCYQWYLIATTGQSLAKRWMKIKIVRLDGSPVGFVNGVLLREWVLFGFQMIPIVGRIVGFADGVMIFGNDRRCLHDQIAGTKVVLVLAA